jgi:20S proteasome subunit beta 3
LFACLTIQLGFFLNIARPPPASTLITNSSRRTTHFIRYEKLKYRVNLYGLRENREIKASTFANMCQSVLYERRFGPYFVEPVIAGLEDGKPYLCAMDLIGAPLKTDDFVLAGTAAQAMFGLAETLWKPDLSEDELFEVISQVILNSLDRDALAGWGARVYILTTDRLITKDLRARQD